jgi:PAS domain S-box-containing protein
MLSNMDAAYPPPSFPIAPSVEAHDPLSLSEARFRALAQATGHIYWVANGQGMLTDAASWCTFTGQPPEEVANDGWAAAVHPDDREHALSDWQAAVASGQPYRREHRVRRADGQYRMMLAQAFPIRAPNGTISEWVGVDTDITLLQELQADIRASQEEFRTTFELAAVGMAHVRPDGRILRANQKFCAILGYSQDELQGRSFQELTYSPDLDANLALLERLLAGEISTYSLEKRYLRKDGSLVWVHLTASLKRDQVGTPAYGIAVVEDISARKAAEEALRQSEQQYRQLFETMAQGVIYYSPDGKVLSANPAALRMLGVSSEQVLGRTTRESNQRVIGEDGSSLSHEARPTSRALHTCQTVSDVVGVFNPQEQRYRWFHVTAIPEFRPGEQIPYQVFATFEDITEQRRLEEELRMRVQELEAIFASMNDGLIVHRADGTILRSNPAYLALVGWPADAPFHSMSREERRQTLQIRDMQGQPIPLEQLPLSQNLRGESVTQEQIFRNRDGQDSYVIVRGAPLVDTTGRVIGSVEVVHDVTEQRRLEREAAAYARELEAIFTSMNDGLIVFRADGTILRSNPAYEALVGWPVDSALYSMSPEERRQTLQIRDTQGDPLTSGFFPLERILQGQSLAEEQIIRSRDGRDVHVSVRGAPLTDSAGQIEGAVLVVHDITERQRLEQQTQEALKALLRMAELLVQHPLGGEEQSSLLVGRHLAELACTLLGCPVAMIITLDPQTLSMQVMGTVGYTPEQEARLHDMISTWTHTPPDLADIERLVHGETLVLDTTQPPYQEYAAIFDIRQAVVAPMQLGGQLIGIVVFNPNKLKQAFTEQQIALAGATAQLVALVVERERLLREHEDARAHSLALDKSNQQMDTFLSLISHELRTPLASMKLSLQVIHHRLERAVFDISPTESYLQTFLGILRELFEPAERNAVRLERLVNDLLEAARLKQGRLELRLKYSDLNTIVQETVAEQQELTPEHHIHLRLSANQPLWVLVDVDRIRQAIMNYLTNALKYSPETMPVVVGVERAQGLVRVWVRDQGPGIPLDEQARLWERFQRVPGIREQSGSAGGLGLGLYITRMVIEGHHGQVGLTSAPGEGATFWFTLPLCQEA